MFTLWMLLFWAQTSLIASGRRDLHIQLGGAGMVLAVLLVPLMYATAVGQVARANQPPFSTPLAWTSVPLFIIPPFAILVWQGWKHRRTAQAHKRLMLGAALIMMDPAIGRFPILPPFLLSFGILNLLSWLTFAPLFWWDMRTLGRSPLGDETRRGPVRPGVDPAHDRAGDALVGDGRGASAGGLGQA